MYKLSAAVNGMEEELRLVDNYIDEYLHVTGETGAVGAVINAVRAAQGKMLRPILLLLVGRFGSDYPICRNQMCRLAALVEVVHMASLVHDDIVDDSPLRRGRPTVQSQFGKDMAVYAGDFMLCRGMFHLFQQNLGEAGMILSHTIEQMCRGEMGQFAHRWDTETTMETYLNNIHGKTVALFVAACRLGALAGNCTEGQMSRLTRLGEHLGYMFQLRDDLLDYVSNEQHEGKPVHKDFCDGIYTMPVLYALGQKGCGGQLRAIARENAAGRATPQLLSEMRQLVCASGGIEFTCEQISNHAVQAQRQLAFLPHNIPSGVIQNMICWLRDNRIATAVPAPEPFSPQVQAAW